METFSIWHWLIAGTAVYLCYRVLRSSAASRDVRGGSASQDSSSDRPANPLSSFSLKAWTKSAGYTGVLVGVVAAGLSPNEDPFFVRALVLALAWGLIGALLGATAYVLVRATKGTVGAVKAAAPVAAVAAVAATRAGADAITQAKKSSLEKKLEELDKLHASGKISAEERAAARTAALERD